MSELELGCCGAYCRTCKVYIENLCKGCKIGYVDGTRDLAKAKCQIKICCISQNYASCADCIEYRQCETINNFYNHQGYKYKKYKQAIEYIINAGYEAFFQIADEWENAYGKYE
ncbi:MAG: DUF3795 domain-containing protein [Eubacteriaceae bacterium]|nr:DUF3795 domain-containing protein [Eubacteriaceae bacterium]